MRVSRTCRKLARFGRPCPIFPLFLSGGLACAAQPASPAPAPPRTGFVAQPCAGLELGAEPLDPKDARFFVEVAELVERLSPSGPPLSEQVVTLRSSVNLVAFPSVPTSMPWGQCVDAVCASTQRSVSVTATLPGLASEPIELQLRFEEAPAEGAGESRALLDTTLHARNQEPVVLPAAPAVSGGSLVVTAYLLRRHDDLHRVLECKVRQAEREKELRP